MTSKAHSNQGHSAPTDRPPTATVDLVNGYLASFYRGDFETARAVVADDFSFSGPFLQVEGKDAFFLGAEGLRHIVRGHRLLRQWEDSNEVSSIYEVTIETTGASGSVVMSEWHTIRGAQLVSGRVVFDTAVFRSLVAQS